MTRTRFAPSPTGYLHIGGARTALFAYLFAKKNQGQFVLRIEDTDRERSTHESVQAIFDGMKWLGLDADEPAIFQTDRFDRYREIAQFLLDKNLAYWCYSSKEELEKLREQQMNNKEKPRYDGRWRPEEGKILPEIPTGIQPVLRFKNPLEGNVVFHDAVHGEISVNNSELDDLIILRSDNTPTYNFCVVVDDFDMKITHVIRGDDHLNNTPRQINILKALNATLPIYAHVPMILDEEGKKLSKRTGAAAVTDYRDAGYLPHAVLNYLARLGWSHGDQEIFSLTEMQDLFNLENLQKSAARLNPEKLIWLNQHYLKTLPDHEILPHLAWHFTQHKLTNPNNINLHLLLNIQKERCATLCEMVEKSLCFYQNIDELSYDETAKNQFLTQDAKLHLFKLNEVFNAVNDADWLAENLNKLIKDFMKTHQLKMPQIAQPLRVALTGNTHSPAIDKTLMLFGKSATIARLEKAINLI